VLSKFFGLKNDTNTKKYITNNKNFFKILHQNTGGFKSNVDELSNSLSPDHPNIICVTEHHLKNYEINNLPIDRFKLKYKFCIQFKKCRGWGCVFSFMKILISSLSHFINTAKRRILRFVL